MFGLVLARPSPNKLICLLAVFCIRCEVETKYELDNNQRSFAKFGLKIYERSKYSLHEAFGGGGGWFGPYVYAF